MRITAIGLIVVAFVITAILGTVIALQVQVDNMDISAIALQSFFGFLVVAPIFLIGIYAYVRSSQPTPPQQESEMALQRQLTDILALHSPISVTELAVKLNQEPNFVEDLLLEMVHLRVFNGYINWITGMIAILTSDEIRNLSHCKNCGSPITLNPSDITDCPTCQTQYFST